jgi:hypothetical protein
MNSSELYERLKQLEFHQKLLLKMISGSTQQFYKLIIEKSITEKEVDEFFKLCDKLSCMMIEQKEEGFVYFHPLFEILKTSLHPNLDIQEVIYACLQQKLYVPLMTELKKCLID